MRIQAHSSGGSFKLIVSQVMMRRLTISSSRRFTSIIGRTNSLLMYHTSRLTPLSTSYLLKAGPSNHCSFRSSTTTPAKNNMSFSTTSTTDTTAPIILKRVKQDLLDADVNHDGRIDFEELKLILSKYSNVFTEKDVETIGELFYVGKGGKSVSHTFWEECFILLLVTTIRLRQTHWSLKTAMTIAVMYRPNMMTIVLFTIRNKSLISISLGILKNYWNKSESWGWCVALIDFRLTG